MHTHRLESHDWKSCAELARCYFSFVVDRGPERKISNINVDPLRLFPHWQDRTSQGDDLEELFNENQVRVRTDGAFDLLGPFHKIENIQARVLTRLPSWKEHKACKECMCSFFHASYTRDLFCNACLTGDRLHWRSMFSSGPPKLEGGRVWGVLLKGTDWLLDRENLLARSFDRARMLQGVLDVPYHQSIDLLRERQMHIGHSIVTRTLSKFIIIYLHAFCHR